MTGNAVENWNHSASRPPAAFDRMQAAFPTRPGTACLGGANGEPIGRALSGCNAVVAVGYGRRERCEGRRLLPPRRENLAAAGDTDRSLQYRPHGAKSSKSKAPM